MAVGLMLGHSRVGQRFVEVLMAEYEGRLLTTDVECEVMSSPDNAVVLGSNWLYAWCEVWRSRFTIDSRMSRRVSCEWVLSRLDFVQYFLD